MRHKQLCVSQRSKSETQARSLRYRRRGTDSERLPKAEYPATHGQDMTPDLASGRIGTEGQLRSLASNSHADGRPVPPGGTSPVTDEQATGFLSVFTSHGINAESR